MLKAVSMPTWGLAMEEGTITKWLVSEGMTITPGVELVEIETTKIANVMEATDGGVLRRIVVNPGETRPCGDLLAVLSDAVVSEEEIDAFVSGFVRAEAAGDGDTGPKMSEPVILDLPGGPIRYLCRGDTGPSVVLIHGFGGDLDSWMFNQTDLSDQFQVFAIDLPGHGGSRKVVGAGDIGALVSPIAEALDTLGLADVHLVGHSLGGAVAVELAARQPERCLSLALIAPAGFTEEINGNYIADFIAAGRSRDIQRCLTQLFADPSAVTREMAERIAQYKRLDGVEEALGAIQQACFRDGKQQFVLTEQLISLACPILVAWGAQDSIIPPETLKMIPGRPAAHLIDDAGHMPQMEQAGVINELLRSHFAAAEVHGKAS